ncbi:peptidase [Thermosipho melanesiensis]|uniref:ATP-dependent protease subunit HslV n=2 Tax=Thermosipho melanesiensis TaxID=46541 RepID=HSLV_THEM4|nr:ATP-dependent protease subunit HslV [Thermosipho melanesiensis]A6LJK3.1 RecName: Full=ATP-dependent protease subunit HslV [Thermosipho melanesiensis BI429]ABR30104.1 20S proteasome, A and B subunits [Thermosipho melanesiensis BI429]APT73301.1 peptidase [Thermosipho melanesiensis]OOC38692.1 peptidase [Thermosipho melanesiensis]OOC40496.1 peptidase [Thermosipho melanesiensis]OOC40761.1 peptidase [Thermosipho melanesiensis]
MKWRSTTVVCVRKNDSVVMVSDGQVTYGNTIMKGNAKKVRKMGEGNVLAGFAGSVADAMALFDRFEAKYREWGGNLLKSAVELAKDWRTDRVLRRLEALLLVADKKYTFIISGTGEVIQPEDDIASIGSGSPYAIAAGRALLKHTNLSAKEIALESIRIASEICIYTNDNFTIEEL